MLLKKIFPIKITLKILTLEFKFSSNSVHINESTICGWKFLNSNGRGVRSCRSQVSLRLVGGLCEDLFALICRILSFFWNSLLTWPWISLIGKIKKKIYIRKHYYSSKILLKGIQDDLTKDQPPASELIIVIKFWRKQTEFFINALNVFKRHWSNLDI